MIIYKNITAIANETNNLLWFSISHSNVNPNVIISSEEVFWAIQSGTKSVIHDSP